MLQGSITAVVSLVALTTVARAQCPSGESPFHARGLDGDVRAFATFDDGHGPALYAAGGFAHADGVATSCVARWDGASWTPLPGVVTGQVNALAVFDDGSGPALYIGGAFLTAGGVASHGIARWNGASWSSLNGGIDGTYGWINAIEVFDDGSGAALYVTGNFDFVGGMFARNVAKWNGAAWSGLTGGLSYSNLMTPFGTSLEVFDDGSGPALYVGGAFDHAGAAAANRVAKWNGSGWSALGVGVSNVYDEVWSLRSFDDGGGARLYVGGVYTSAGGLPALSIARWNGSTWSTLGAGLGFTINTDPYVYTLEVLDDGSGPALYAGGKFNISGSTALANIARWNGTAWVDVAGGFILPGSHAEIRALALFDDGAGPVLFAGGKFDRAGNVHANSIAVRRAGSWTELSDGQGVGGSVFALISHPTLGGASAVYAAGSFNASGPLLGQEGCVRRWDGAQWSGIGLPSNASAYALAIHDDGSGESLFVGGVFQQAGGVAASNIAKWNGSTWAPLGGGLDGPVQALAVYDDGSGPKLIAGGNFANAGGAPASRIARWDGANWTALGSGISAGGSPQVLALTVLGSGPGAQLFAAGQFLLAGGTNARNIARWNGSSWFAVGNSGVTAGLSYTAHALAVFDDGSGPAVYVGGEFQTADSLTVNRIAKWNGASWAGLSTGVDYHGVYALHVYDDGAGARLYAAGSFFNAGGVHAVSIAKWDGANWSAVGAGVTGYPEWINALGTFADPARPWPSLYLGGQFPSFDGFDSQRIARWSDACVGQATGYCTAGTTANGCTAHMSASGSASASAASGFVVHVADVEGAKAGTLFFGTSGPLAAPWGNGTSVLCLAQPFVRTGVQSGVGAPGTCDGVYSQDFNAWMSANPTRAPAAGSLVRMQTWFRDPGNGSNKTTSLSDALSFVVTP